ncbi:MAG: hypothetical protein AABZ74_13825 [Cyanobacteriota bacterium]
MTKKKIEYLSYLEYTKKHYSKIEDMAICAVENAIKAAKDKKLDITYFDGKNIIKESFSGQTTIIKTEHIERRKVKIGSKSTLSKKS